MRALNLDEVPTGIANRVPGMSTRRFIVVVDDDDAVVSIVLIILIK